MVHVRSWAVPILAAVVLLMFVCAEDVRAAPGSNGKPAKFDFTDCGGAKACLGLARLERVRKRSGKSHQSADELAKDLDKDKDLVSVTRNCSSIRVFAAQVQATSCRA